jgi:nucleotide-binding universal stress UspA family protein
MIREERERMFNKILAASDGSAAAMKAVEAGAAVAKAFGAELTVVTVAYIPRMYQIDLGDDMKRAYVEDWEHVLRDSASAVRRVVDAKTKLLHEGTPADAILEEAERGGYDLVVVGSTGMGGTGRAVIGNVAVRVGARANCSVMVVR